MEKFRFFNETVRRKFLSRRKGELKLGQELEIVQSFEEMAAHPAKYIIFGVPEELGVRANYGKPGAFTAWGSFLSSFLNIQSNQFNDAKNCLILGIIECRKIRNEADRLLSENIEMEKVGALVQMLDDRVSETVEKIVAAGKVPIIIGGGHNNAYGNIRGTSRALKKAINVLNIDAHTDLRATDYRHSGNGFSYAKNRGYLNKYSMFGIHKNYTPQYIFDQFKDDKDVNFQYYEDLLGGELSHKFKAYHLETEFLGMEYGLEIDCDAIADFPSSAMTPSGFSVDTIRNFIGISAKQNPLYLHICEAAATDNPQIGKALSYFVSDFMRK